MNDLPDSGRHARYRPIILYVALCACVFLGTTRLIEAREPIPRTQSEKDAAAVPADLASFMREALSAVNTHDPKALAPFATADAARTFRWVAETTTKEWQSDVLSIPPAHEAVQNDGADAQRPVYLAVFHAWHTCESDGDHVHLLTSTANGWRLGAEIPETDPGGFRIRDHDLHVSLDVPDHTAQISDRVRIERTQDSVPPFCLLRLSQDFHVRQFSLDGTQTLLRQAGGILLFTPPASKTFTITLQYSGMVDHRGSDYIIPTEATLDSYWYPHIARLPATATITVVAPPGWTPIAQGEPVRRQHGPAGVLEVTFRNDIPVSFFTVDMGPYHVTTRQADGRTLSAYLLRNDPAFADRCLNVLQRALSFYDAHFARFPYSRYTLVETNGSFDGALEAYSFATFQTHTLPGTIPHELSHTWWGGLVPCTYLRSMWDESFADYSDDLCDRMTHNEPLDQNDSDRHTAYGHRFDTYSLAEAHDTGDGRQSAVGYDKGALVLRVLEAQIGRDVMLSCLHTFAAERSRREPAEWPDFEQIVNRITGQDYSWFFTQWVQRKGLPSLQLTNVTSRRDSQGYLIEADIVQTDPIYRLRVPVRLETRGGDHLSQTIKADALITHISLHARSAPTHLTLDPGNLLPLAAADDLSYDFTEIRAAQKL